MIPLTIEGLEGWHFSSPLFTFALNIISASGMIGAVAIVLDAYRYMYPVSGGPDKQELLKTALVVVLIISIPLIWVVMMYVLNGVNSPLG